MLDVINLTSFTHLAFAAIDADESMAEVIVAKGTYALTPQPKTALDMSLVPILSDEASAILVRDEYFGALNKSSVRTESDLAPFKPRCDLIVIGSAHSPTGKPVKAVTVGIAIDRAGETIHSHGLRVHGERYLMRRDALDRGAAAIVWLATAGSVEAPEWYLTEAQLFLECPLRYEISYGGELRVASDDACAERVATADRLNDEERQRHPDGAEAPIAHRACRMNPIGRGFVEAWHARATRVRRYPAPRIEAVAAPFTPDAFHALVRGRLACGGDPALEPQGFGVVTKSWQPRLKLAGTYDAAWRETRWPNPPPDFDMAFWNGAHRSMQCPHLKGGEVVTLTNLLPHGTPGTRATDPLTTVASLRLPVVELALRLERDDGRVLYGLMPIDTLTVDLDAMVLHIVWRIRVPAAMPVKETCLVSLAEARAREAVAVPA